MAVTSSDERASVEPVGKEETRRIREQETVSAKPRDPDRRPEWRPAIT